MNAKSKSLWREICRSLLNDHPDKVNLLLDWKDEEQAEMLSALKQLTVQASIAGNHCLKERGFADLHDAISLAQAEIAKAERGAS